MSLVQYIIIAMLYVGYVYLVSKLFAAPEDSDHERTGVSDD